MPVNKKDYSSFKSLNLNLNDENIALKGNIFITAQGLELNNYFFNEQINDFKVKNYSSNLLTQKNEINEVFEFKSNEKYNNIDINTKLVFSALSPASASNFLSFLGNKSINDSNIAFGSLDENNTNFILDFLNEFECNIKVDDGDFIKFLSQSGNEFIFKTINNTTLSSNYTFNYSYDENAGYLSLFKDISDKLFLIAPNQGVLSACTPNDKSSLRGIIKVNNLTKKIDTNNFSNFVFYDYDNNYSISNQTLTGEKFNFLTYFTYENNILSSNNEYYNNLKFFNLKNQVSNLNNINPLLPLENKTLQKDYTTILNTNTTEKNNENLLFGYNFYTKEYKFLPDKITKFTLPDNLFPYQKANINDTNLIKSGSYPGKSPYFSDKIFKLLDDNKNINDNVKDINQIFLLEDNSFLLFENIEGKLLKQEFNEVFLNDNSGNLLCTWLSGDNNNGVWFDRYYYPVSNGLNSALSGSTDQIFDSPIQAKEYFRRFGIKEIYYDIESNLTFQPKSTYFYSRIGNNYINKLIEKQKNKEVKNTFNLTFSGKVITEKDELKFDDLNYDVFDFDNLNSNNFNISFDLNYNQLSSINSYQIFGNLYEDGFSLKNNFYFTPFIILPDNNNLYFYDTKFNLLKVNNYPTLTSITDVMYLEQNNNIVVADGTNLLKTNYTGEIIDVNNSVSINNDIRNITSNIDGRIFKGYNKAFFLNNSEDKTGNNLFKLELNNLSLSSTQNQYFTGFNSIIDTASGVKALKGFKGKKLTDSIGVSISADSSGNKIFFEDLTDNYDLSSLRLDFSKPLSSSKTIYDINVYDEKLYVQSFNGTSNNVNQGYIHIFNSERQLLSTFNLTTSAASGYKIDFINEDNNIKLLSFSRDVNKKLIVDKFSLVNGLSTTYNLGISTNDIAVNGKSNNINPVGFEFLENKYKEFQNKLFFKLNIKNFLESNFISVQWNDAGPPIFPGLSSFTFSNPALNLSAWDGRFDDSVLETQDTNFELLLPFNNLNLKNNSFSFNFNLINGQIDVYLNGAKKGSLVFSPNLFTINSLKFPDLFFNIQNIKNIPIIDISKDNNLYGQGGSIRNLKLYNNTISEDLIKYLYLKNKKIDDLVFDIPCGARNNVEEINSLYNYNIPGRKNNNFKVYIKNGRFTENSIPQIKTFLDKKISKTLPINVNNVEYNFDLN